MQIYFHSRLCSYLSRVPILVEGTVHRGKTSGKVSEKRDNPHVCAHLRMLKDFQYMFIKLSFAGIFLF